MDVEAVDDAARERAQAFIFDEIGAEQPKLEVSADGKGYENVRPEHAKPHHMPKFTGSGKGIGHTTGVKNNS
jgi:hypothetical protein